MSLLNNFFALHRPRPAYERQLQQGGNQIVRSPRAAILASARLAQQLGLRFVESLAGGRARS